MDESKNMFDRDALMHNMSALDGCRSYMTLFAAVGTGILGATGGRGLACFALAYVAVSAALLARMRGDAEAYTNEGVAKHLVGGVTNYALSFVLFWTLSYALVHIY